MHNVQRLYSAHQIHGFVLGVWKTDLFRDAHSCGLHDSEDYRNGGTHNFISKIVADFAKLPRFVFDMTDDKIERAHFSTWWGGIPNRTYDNPYIHDLYWLHEMSHAGSMVYVPSMNFENFLRKMTDNELHASVVSEVQVYFELPELRKLSFQHEIYADRFLDNVEFAHLYKVDPELAFEEIKVRRRDTMMDPNPKNVSDFWIHRFYTQNAAWGACWAHSYNRIELEMTLLRRQALSKLYVGDVRKTALDAFFSKVIEPNTTDDIPFKREAEAFAGIYWANRGHYDDTMKVKEKS